MDIETIQRLVNLNHQFYQSCAHSFSQTRQRVQPGVRRVIQTYITPFVDDQILDLGCGNGDLIPALEEENFYGKYTGLDFSSGLLEENKFQSPHFQIEFQEADITRVGWTKNLQKERNDVVFSFAVLHHIPDQTTREQILEEIHQLLKPEGLFIFSTWQFQRSPRLAKRILPWSQAGIDPTLLDTGDYLLDWRGSSLPLPALRYVHVYDGMELSTLANHTGFRLVEQFSSDGKEGNLSDYLVWEKM